MSDGTEDSTRTIGPILQEARTAKGLTIEAAAAASKVPLSFVRLMEQEQFHLVPDLLYLTGFLTEYAIFLSLDPKQLLAQLKEQVNSARVREAPHPMPSIGSRTDLRRLLIYLLPAAAVIPLIFIGLSLFSGPPPTVPPAQTMPAPPSAETGAPSPESLIATQPSPQATPSIAEQPQEVPAAHPITAAPEQEPQSSPSRYRLRAEAKETTWLAVSADGSPRKEVLLRPGEAAQWSANNGFSVTIGNPRGITLSLNNRLIALKGEPGGVIRNLALPGDGGLPSAGQ
jgi:cytoskeleton protein RodZ